LSESRFVGCMVGSAIGDALGAVFEGTWTIRKIEEINFRGRWTDDTHMTIGLAESLVANKGFDSGHMAQTFRARANRHGHHRPEKLDN
jgi:ADP-ribosylglycohydrolase